MLIVRRLEKLVGHRVSRYGRSSKTMPFKGYNRHLSFGALSVLLQTVIKNALDEKVEDIKPHIGWLCGGPKTREEFLSQDTYAAYLALKPYFLSKLTAR